MKKRDIIVVGASAGGVKALKEFVGGLPKDFEATIFAVLHIPAHVESHLPQILARSGPLPAVHPADGDLMKKGMIYLAPSDHHLLLEEGKIMVKKGPLENRFRPSIDVLFRSAAYVYGSRVVGILLSGMLNDGISGLWSIKLLDGLAIVQHPDDASRAEMPRNALSEVQVDYSVSAKEMGSLLGELTVEASSIDTSQKFLDVDINGKDELTSFNCPRCNEVLVKQNEGDHLVFRCFSGHIYTAGSIISELSDSVERMLWKSMQGIRDMDHLLKDIKEHFHSMGLSYPHKSVAS